MDQKDEEAGVPIDDLDLSNGARCALARGKPPVTTIGQLVRLTEAKLRHRRTFRMSATGVREIKRRLAERGLHLAIRA